MEKSELKKSPVTMKENHTYWLGEKQLSGITELIKTMVLGRPAFKDLPEQVQMNFTIAGNRGTVLHTSMELLINMGVQDDNQMLKVLCDNYPDEIATMNMSEYIVSDGKHFASPIDAVGFGEDGITLWDFKTSTEQDIDYWRWQLSTYRYLFKLQNGFYPDRLKVMWINKNHEHAIFDIQPIEDEHIVKMLEEGAKKPDERNYQNPFVVATIGDKDAMMAEYYDMSRKFAEAKLVASKLEEGLKGIEENIKAFMEANNVKKIDNEYLTATYVAPTQRVSVDSKKLKESYPEVYDECTKTSEVKSSVRIKTK